MTAPNDGLELPTVFTGEKSAKAKSSVSSRLLVSMPLGLIYRVCCLAGSVDLIETVRAD